MKTTFLLAALLSSFTCTHSQITTLASAAMHFDSTTQESISGIFPSSLGQPYIYTDDRLGNPYSAIKCLGTLNYGNPAFSQMGTSDFSIAFWFRKDGSLWPERKIFDKFFSSISPGAVITEGYIVSYQQVAGPGNMRTVLKTLSDSTEVTGSMGLFSEDVWGHVVLSYDRDDSLRIYVNGSHLQSTYIAHMQQHGTFFNTPDLKIGEGNMSLDEIYFFQFALSPSEVVELYNTQPSPASLVEAQLQNSVLVYPIPNSGQFNLQFSEDIAKIQSIKLFDLMGQEIPFEKNPLSSNATQVNVSRISKGIHLLQIESEKGIITKKITIQ
jgi:Secretion system C-terminal sorting domain/Concanavalin A-like lectin/glucanases superfamily